MKALAPTTRSKASRSSARIGSCWRSRATNGTRSLIRGKRRKGAATRSVQPVPELPQRRVDPSLDGRELLAGQIRDLRDREVGAVPQGERPARVVVEALEPARQ